MCPYLAHVRRLNNISKTIKSSLHNFMYVFKDNLGWYLIWLPDLRPPISALTTLTTLKTFKVALHWLWLLEWLELLPTSDLRDGDKIRRLWSCRGCEGKAVREQWGQSKPCTGSVLPLFSSHKSGIAAWLSGWIQRAAGGEFKGRQTYWQTVRG